MTPLDYFESIWQALQVLDLVSDAGGKEWKGVLLSLLHRLYAGWSPSFQQVLKHVWDERDIGEAIHKRADRPYKTREQFRHPPKAP